MRIPTIHSNGTDGETLLAEYERALVALITARELVAKITVHGRDYYTQSAYALPEAIDAHVERIRALQKVEVDLQVIAQAILDQVNERKAARS